MSSNDYIIVDGFRIRKDRPDLLRLLEDYKSIIVKGTNAPTPTTTIPNTHHYALTALCRDSVKSTLQCLLASESRYQTHLVVHINRHPHIPAFLCLPPSLDTSTTRARVHLAATPISMLHAFQRTRLLASSSFIAPVVLRLSMCDTSSEKSKTYMFHTMMRYIASRATGAKCTKDKIAAPYIEHCNNQHPEEVEEKYARISAKPLRKQGGEFAHVFKQLTGRKHDNKWIELRKDIGKMKRGEMTSREILSQPWVYSLRFTFMRSVKGFLDQIEYSRILPLIQIPAAAAAAAANAAANANIIIPVPVAPPTPAFVKTGKHASNLFRVIVRAHKMLTPEFMGIFGLPPKFIKSMITRSHFLATDAGLETAALLFGLLMPCMMTPDIHLNVNVGSKFFTHQALHVKTDDRDFGFLKLRFQDIIPARCVIADAADADTDEANVQG